MEEKTYKISLKKDHSCKICSCGKSKIMPICDNSHRELNEKDGTNFKSIKIKSSEDTDLEINSNMWEEN